MSILARNRRARYDYEVRDTYQAGLVLEGSEVKSIRTGNASLSGSFVRLQDNEAWLVNAHVGHYQHAPQHDERRSRKLLLTTAQLKAMRDGTQQGLYIVPLALRTSHGFIKLDVGLGSARRKADKRERIRAREDHREARHSTK